MPRVVLLPPTVADQIAAGEVVERPASAVKELLENALDAGATTVEIAIEDGGRSLIRVSDDGCGMEREDALLALARHATSKIAGLEDLVGVRSFGFRGEALPAICSVSRLEITTATTDSAGTQIRAAAGAVGDVRPANRRRGTTVSVAQLFYNVPARLKFLRSARSEWRAISEAVIGVAVARRDVRLTITHDGKTALALAPANSLRARCAAIWGAPYVERFLEADGVLGPTRVSGLVERPADVGTASRRVAVVVNGRPVRDAGLVRAAEAAYRSTVPAGFRPSLVLELTVPGESVDVNVHPAKAEVRFRDRWEVERAVEHVVRRALGTDASAAAIGRAPAAVWSARPEPLAADTELLRRVTPGLPLLAMAAGVDATPAPAARGIGTATSPESVPPLVQLRRTYLGFESPDGLVLIDQHSAHERVLYERFVAALDGGGAASQRLLLPLTLHLGPAEAEAFDAHREVFERLGFEIDAFGGHSLVVSAVPTPHPRFDAARCLRESLAAMTGDRVPSTAAAHEHLAATIACKAAIKAGDQLSADEMRALYADLRRTSLPAHDVHGRATIVHLSWDELDRRFGRR